MAKNSLDRTKVLETLLKNLKSLKNLGDFVPESARRVAVLESYLPVLNSRAIISNAVLKAAYEEVKQSYKWIAAGRVAKVTAEVSRLHAVWLSGTLAGQYRKTVAFKTVVNWLEGPAKADDPNGWILQGSGFSKGLLKSPWGVCPECKKTLLPKKIRGVWKVFGLCSACNRKANLELENEISGFAKAQTDEAQVL